ncbi:MAG: urate oxidase [Streptosporangiales bacterium]|nr:urate oxidase [Streptosporangiales bacterium]
MGHRLGPNTYGKAEIRLLHVDRDGPRHEVRDLTVGVTLAGAFDDTYLTGDNSAVLPTDSQKNTVYAFARRHGIGAVEDFARRLARRFVTAQPETVAHARVTVVEHPWARTGGHSFAAPAGEGRTAEVTATLQADWTVAGLTGLLLLKTTGSEFRGFLRDAYTTLPETDDRILATEVEARWRYGAAPGDWDAAHGAAREALIGTFGSTHSRSLQQSLYAMGGAVLDAVDEVAEVRLRLPNRHHLLVDLGPFGLDNENVVFHPDDRPYGLITGTVSREGAPPPGLAWV